MNKTELTKVIAEKAGLTQKEVSKAIDAVFGAITNALKKGEKVQLIGFGNFEVRDRAARKGPVPQLSHKNIPKFYSLFT